MAQIHHSHTKLTTKISYRCIYIYKYIQITHSVLNYFHFVLHFVSTRYFVSCFCIYARNRMRHNWICRVWVTFILERYLIWDTDLLPSPFPSPSLSLFLLLFAFTTSFSDIQILSIFYYFVQFHSNLFQKPNDNWLYWVIAMIFGESEQTTSDFIEHYWNEPNFACIQ